MPSDFDDLFDELTENTSRDESLQVLRHVYKTPTGGDRDADNIIADCVWVWNSRASDQEGSSGVASTLDIVFIQEEKFVSLRRIGVCLDAIGVTVGKDGEKFVDKNQKNAQVAARLFHFWSSHFPACSLTVFIGQLFVEEQSESAVNLRKFWCADLVNELDPLEAKRLSAFVLSNQKMSSSGSASRKALLGLLAAPSGDKVEKADEEPIGADDPQLPARKPDGDQLSTSLGDFRELIIGDKPTRPRKSLAEKGKQGKSKQRAHVETDGSTDESSDDDHEDYHEKDPALLNSTDGKDDLGCLSAKLHLANREGGPGFAEFLSPLTLKVTTKTELYKVI